MKIKLITLKIKDKDFTNLKKLSKELFKTTNDPSFNITEPLTILGKTNLKSFSSLKIQAIDTSILFDKTTTSKENICYIASIENPAIKELKELLCIKTNIHFKSNYFNLLEDFDSYPLIKLGNAISNKIEVPKVVINDYRLELLEIEVQDNKTSFRILDTIHLSKDKVL